MSTYFKYIVAVSLAAVLLVPVSCTKNFSEISKNPNASEEALPQALLAPALVPYYQRIDAGYGSDGRQGGTYFPLRHP